MPVELRLLGFPEDPSTPKTSGYSKEFKAMVNPSSIKHSRGMLYNTDDRANGSIDVKQWKGYAEETLELSLVLDGTGYSTDDKKTATPDQLKDILAVIYDYDGGTHKPMYVVINWAEYAFLGHLKTLSTDFNVFDVNGVCTLATISMQFTLHMDNETAAMKQNRSSPDMSHLQVMKDGDRIPLICNDIYDDPNYYVQIAELNGLTNFRDVSIGKKLLFPPLINK